MDPDPDEATKTHPTFKQPLAAPLANRAAQNGQNPIPSSLV